MSQHLSLPKDKIRFLLLEGVHQNAIDTLKAAGYSNIDYHKTALEGDALKAAVKDAQSKAAVLAEASGRRIIGVRAIEEQGVNLRRPVALNYEMKSAADGVGQQQAWAGDITVTATIIVTYDF